MSDIPTPQDEHHAGTAGCSQSDRILSALHDAGVGTWVPMPALAKAASPSGEGVGICVSRRIYDLRKKLRHEGWDIKQASEFFDGQHHSMYRIIRVERDSVEPSLPSQPSRDTES